MRDEDLLDSYRLGQRDFQGALLPNLRLPYVILRGVNLSGADLTGAHLLGADLFGANLAGSKLNRANLTEANLEMADLSGASLIDTLFVGANLRSAVFSGASVDGAVFDGAHLGEARFLGPSTDRMPTEDVPAPKAPPEENVLVGVRTRIVPIEGEPASWIHAPKWRTEHLMRQDGHKHIHMIERTVYLSVLVVRARLPFDGNARNLFAQLAVALGGDLKELKLRIFKQDAHILLIRGEEPLNEHLGEVFARRAWMRQTEGDAVPDPALRGLLAKYFQGDLSALTFLARLCYEIELWGFVDARPILRGKWVW